VRVFDQDLAQSLAGGATTLCWCWRVTRRDGAVFGFTDHDRDLVVNGLTFEASSGFSASEMSSGVGLSVDNLECEGALDSEALSEEDLDAGLFDDALVELLLVDWAAPATHAVFRTGSLGEVKRAGAQFSAEVRGLTHYLQQPVGRLYQYTCDADLGDHRCGVDVNDPAYSASTILEEVLSARAFTCAISGGFEAGWFTHGSAEFLNGAAAGQRVEIKVHQKLAGAERIELWADVKGPLQPGQQVRLTAGCDKSLSQCRARFSNAVNFRGFPFIPGNDFISQIGRPGRSGR